MAVDEAPGIIIIVETVELEPFDAAAAAAAAAAANDEAAMFGPPLLPVVGTPRDEWTPPSMAIVAVNVRSPSDRRRPSVRPIVCPDEANDRW